MSRLIQALQEKRRTHEQSIKEATRELEHTRMEAKMTEARIEDDRAMIAEIDRAIAALQPTPSPGERVEEIPGLEIPEGFTMWPGGVSPVEHMQWFEVIRRDGSRSMDQATSYSDWRHVGRGSDILAYRILPSNSSEGDGGEAELEEPILFERLCEGCVVGEGEPHEADCPVLADIREANAPALIDDLAEPRAGDEAIVSPRIEQANDAIAQTLDDVDAEPPPVVSRCSLTRWSAASGRQCDGQ